MFKRKRPAIQLDVDCNFSSCTEYSEERRVILQQNRIFLNESDFSIFTSGIRMQIVYLLLSMDSACVCEIQYALNESRQPLISYHLRAMKKAGWLDSERWKKWTFYSINEEKKETLMSMIKMLSQKA